ncbi:DUF4489 domain-containing protein [Anaeromicrobium sediminis]|uniref:DUF4489 domain-containing protein n=1 Tax=Anaeromicrobium sediminis TaxID=1478221 RepID=A0A267MA95_9FIRM|nr:DUF4489 domain-containing protein [Anaeromicrobium sediminis]PAB56367.1 hypothetical protein CCE28_20960 [Anaeromicrobium sediminis]
MTCNHIYEDYKSCKPDEECGKSKPKHPKPQKVLLECGQGTGSKTFTSTEDTPFQLANVTVDTTSLNKPEVVIKFSSLVRLEKIENAPRTVTLKYELFRTYNNEDEEPLSLGTWMFEKADDLQERFVTLEESFSFIFCEKLNCLGCCSYFVKVTPVEITNSTATVSDGEMAALTKTLRYPLEDNCKACSPIYDNIFIPKNFKSKDTILACGQGNGGIVFKDSGLFLPADIAHVTIDTSSLNKPKVLIEFSTIIKISEDADAILQFELFRVCGDGDPVSRGIWKFEMTKSEELVNKAFSFIFCDCNVPSKCCEYFVEVTPIEIEDDDDIDEEDDVTVYNGRMIALAQSSKENFHYDYYKTCDEISDCINRKPLCDKPKEIVLECGSGTGSRTFTSQSEEPFQLANVTIDTTSFCKPIVNIQFSSIVSFELTSEEIMGGEASIQLRYELFRKCDNRRVSSLGVWEFEMTNEEGDQALRTIEGTESFDFTFCEHITCPGCCDYFVTVTAIEIIEGPQVISIATVSNGRIAALAQEG